MAMGTPAHGAVNISKLFANANRGNRGGPEAALPSLISNPPSIRRNPDGNLDENCLTPRSRQLRDKVAKELLAEVCRQRDSVTVTADDDEADDPKAVITMSLPEIISHHKKARQAGHRITISAGAGADLQIGVFHQVMVLLMRDSVCWNRLVAVEALCLENVRQFAKALGTDVGSSMAECLKDKFPPVRRQAIEAVRMMAVNNLLDTAAGSVQLRAIAVGDKDWRLRGEAARALSALGEDAIPELITIMQDSKLWAIRGEAALALGSMDGWQVKERGFSDKLESDACSALQAALKDPKEGVREAAATALGMMGSHAVSIMQPLIMATQDSDLRVRIAAVTALGKIFSKAAPQTMRLRYVKLMEKGDLQPLSQPGMEGTIRFPDSLRLTCRALTATLRDQDPLFQLAKLVSDMENRVQALESRGGASTTTRAHQKEMEALEERRRHIKELFHAAEIALQQIGAYAGPNMVARLTDEDAMFAGFKSRMSLLHGLHCIGNGFGSDDLVCAFLSEWVSSPMLPTKEFSVLANMLPVSGLHLSMFYEDDVSHLRYAVLRGAEGDVYVALAVMNQTEAAKDMLAYDKIESQTVSVKAADGGTRPAYVHIGMWTTLNKIWASLYESLRITIAEQQHENLRRLIICGGHMGGGLAKVATLRFHVEERPLGNVDLPMPDLSDESDKPAGIIVKTFGAPNVISSLDDVARVELMHCCPQSLSWAFPDDLLPKLLSKQNILSVRAFEEVMRPRMGFCCRRGGKSASAAMKKASTYEGLCKMTPVTPAPKDSRSKSISGLDVPVKRYTNALCWHVLTENIPP